MEWNSVNSIIENIISCNYVFLRGIESVTDDFSEGDDWDILCENKETMIKTIGARKLISDEPCYNYFVYVSGRKLLLDIREVGDGYYDTKWEKHMLQHKENNKGIYVLSDEDYKYSILYHCIIHKKEIATKYSDVVERIGDNLNEQIERLSLFMKNNEYLIAKPKDKGVYVNLQNWTMLEEINGRKN